MRHELSRAATVKAITAAVIGTSFISFVGISYIGEFNRCCEMTFLSNFVTGVFMLAASAYIILTGRDLPHFLYLDATALLVMVVFVCSIFAPAASFLSPGVILHLVDPLIMLTFYLALCDGRKSSYPTAFSALVFPSAYYAFMIGFGSFTHHTVYTSFDTTAMSAGALTLYGLAAVAAVIAIAFLSMFLNRALHNLHDGLRAGKAARRETGR